MRGGGGGGEIQSRSGHGSQSGVGQVVNPPGRIETQNSLKPAAVSELILYCL